MSDVLLKDMDELNIARSSNAISIAFLNLRKWIMGLLGIQLLVQRGYSGKRSQPEPSWLLDKSISGLPPICLTRLMAGPS